VKIGQRLALRFTLVSALLTGAILIFIYTVTRGFVHSDFIERLTQQSSLEVLHYATPHVREVIPPGSFLLVNPLTSIYSIDGELLHDEGKYPVPDSWIQLVRTNETFHVERGDYTTVGKQYVVEGERYIVFVSDKDLPGQHELDILRKAMVIGWGVSILLSYLAGLYFASNSLHPVKQVVREVNQITKDNLSYRLSAGKTHLNPDEIDELVFTFNALLQRIESAFVSQKRFVQHASHELKTPLTAIMGEAELALTKERSTDEYKRTLRVIVTETERLIEITEGLLALARLEEGYFSTMADVNLERLVHNTVSTFMHRHPERKISVIAGGLKDPGVLGNEQLLHIVITNLLDNAAKYSDDVIDVFLFEDNLGRVIRISDKGIGIPEAELSKVRTPMYRASNVEHRSGAGLGLSLVQRILEVHGAVLEIRSKPSEGTTCTVMFPHIQRPELIPES
jgi:signal transduction histidine kinase